MNDIHDDIGNFLAQERRSARCEVRAREYQERERNAQEREERRDALFNAVGFCSMVAGSLMAVCGIVALVFKLIVR